MNGKGKYEGVSPGGNLQEALDKAIEQIRKDLETGGIPDAMATWHLEKVNGQYGGIAGFRTVAVALATDGPPRKK